MTSHLKGSSAICPKYEFTRSLVQHFSFVFIVALTLSVASSANALSSAPVTEEQENINRLYERALNGEDYHEALDGIVDYAEREDLDFFDRNHAFTRLEALAAPELKDYLRDVAMGEIEFEGSRRLRDFANRAYWATLLSEAEDEPDEERILVAGLEAVVSLRIEGQNTPNNIGESRLVRRWAADELCRRGKSKHFEKIVRSLDRYQNNEKAQKRIDFCLQQMKVLDKFDSRLATFEHVLDTADPTTHDQLIAWAVDELIDMQPDDLEEILIDHVVRLHDTYDDEEVGFTYYRPFTYLRQKNWTEDEFKAYGFDSLFFM